MRIFSRTIAGRRRVRHTRGGFSLIELLVCIAIIMVISGVVLARYKSFNSTLLLRNLAYEIALSTREAQVLGISVKGSTSGSVTSFTTAYGMHFTPGMTYTLFADTNGNNQYDDGEAVSAYTIGQNNQIKDDAPRCPLTMLDVLFKRPNPDALFYTNATAIVASSVCVSVVASDGNTRTVRIWSTGQIAVE